MGINKGLKFEITVLSAYTIVSLSLISTNVYFKNSLRQ